MDNILAYIIGAMRDGTFTKNERHYVYRIRVYQKNKEWLEKLSKMMAEKFGKKPKLVCDKRNGLWCLLVNSKRIYEQLVKVSEYPDNQADWSTPKSVMSAPKETKINYIRGFFDAEGGVSRIDKKDFKPKDIRIYICQVNKQSLDELKTMIRGFGIKTGKVCGPYFKKGFKKPTYGLMIHGIRNVNSFSENIGSLHPEKSKRLEMIMGLKTPSGRYKGLHGKPCIGNLCFL